MATRLGQPSPPPPVPRPGGEQPLGRRPIDGVGPLVDEPVRPSTRRLQAIEGAVPAEHLERLEQRQPDGAARDGHPHRRLGLGQLQAACRADGLERRPSAPGAVHVAERRVARRSRRRAGRAAPPAMALAHDAGSIGGLGEEQEVDVAPAPSDSTLTRSCTSGAIAREHGRVEALRRPRRAGAASHGWHAATNSSSGSARMYSPLNAASFFTSKNAGDEFDVLEPERRRR